jgi:hypothetical protein
MSKNYRHFYDSDSRIQGGRPAFFVKTNGGVSIEGIRTAVMELRYSKSFDGQEVEDVYRTDRERRAKARKFGFVYVRHRDGTTTLKRKQR